MIEYLQRHYAHARGRRFGKYIFTASGRKFYPLDPSPDDICVEDTARGLGNLCRYAGQIGLDTGYQFYSVAEHSVIVSQYVEKLAISMLLPVRVVDAWAWEGLFHDGTEAYIGDVTRPLKYTRTMRGYRKCEVRVEAALFEAFGVRPTAESRAAVKSIDDRILRDEIEAFMCADEDLNGRLAAFGEPLGCAIAGLPPRRAEHVFTSRFLELCSRRPWGAAEVPPALVDLWSSGNITTV